MQIHRHIWGPPLYSVRVVLLHAIRIRRYRKGLMTFEEPRPCIHCSFRSTNMLMSRLHDDRYERVQLSDYTKQSPFTIPNPSNSDQIFRPIPSTKRSCPLNTDKCIFKTKNERREPADDDVFRGRLRLLMWYRIVRG